MRGVIPQFDNREKEQASGTKVPDPFRCAGSILDGMNRFQLIVAAVVVAATVFALTHQQATKEIFLPIIRSIL